MSDVVVIEDPFSYICDDGIMSGVTWQRGKTKLLSIMNSGEIQCTFRGAIPKHELRQLMIMWLALNYPDCLRFDELEKEDRIRDSTK